MSNGNRLASQGLTVAAFILVEQNNRQFKASLRSRAEFDVTPIAETFGGGGHRQASGAMVPGPLEKAIEQVTSLFAQAFAGTLPSATSPSA